MQGVTRRLCLLVLFIAVLPSCASAQVSVDEIMYDPAGADTGREWIELYNAGGSDATLIGGTVKGSWRVNDGSNHTLTDPQSGVGRGSLVVPAGGYLVIASDPASFFSEYPDGNYSVVKSSISLGNAGGSVSLIDGDGAIVDSVSYTKDLGGYDDGASLQKQPDGSWLAGLPTPGAANTADAYVAPSPDASASSSTDASPQAQASTQQSTAVSSYVPPPVPLLFADAGGGRTVIAGADTEFDARAYDRDQNVLDDPKVRFSWNFGDGTTAEGETVLHHFDYPGRYAVILSIAQNKSAASDQITVTAEPAKLSFALLPDGGAVIGDLAGRDLDLSDWIVAAGGAFTDARFTLPAQTMILAGESMRISKQILGFAASQNAELQYPNGVEALAAGETIGTQATSSATSTALAAPSGVAPAAAPAISRAPAPAPLRASTEVGSSVPAGDQDPEPAPSLAATDTATSAAQVAAVGAAIMGPHTFWWWSAAAALAAAASLALAFASRLSKKEWQIEEV